VSDYHTPATGTVQPITVFDSTVKTRIASPIAMKEEERGWRDATWWRALDWVEANLDHFALPAEAKHGDDLFPLKALAELARVADVLLRQLGLDAAARTRAQALLRFAWNQYGEGSVFERVLTGGPWLVVGTMYSTFEENGYSHAGTRERLSRLSSGAPIEARLLPPHRRSQLAAPAPFGDDAAAVLALDLALAWRRMGLPSPWSSARLFPLTGLGRRPQLASLSEPQAYSLTHVVFFVTDFGLHPEALEAPSRVYLGERCPGWMQDLLRRSDLDLYSELATALACAGEPLPSGVERTLRAGQADDGSLPGPALRSRRRLEATADPGHRRFLERYHTTLAAALASFAATVGLARRPA